jgi:Glu-tRNA(Gln) amidotransferase subunit E-like FAD-binding protein
MTETEVRKIVREILKSEIDKVDKKLDSIKSDVSDLKKKYLDEEGVKKIVRQMIINQHKWMWQKSSSYINNL